MVSAGVPESGQLLEPAGEGMRPAGLLPLVHAESRIIDHYVQTFGDGPRSEPLRWVLTQPCLESDARKVPLRR